MRTKTLLLTAALSAAGAATSMAQVFSVNAVGYVNKTAPPGRLILISNPLTAANNTIAELFKGAANGTQIFRYYPGSGYLTATFDDIDNAYSFSDPTKANDPLLPGEGVFVRNGGAADWVITFVGEVPQGNLSNPLPQGLSIRASQVPQAGTPADLGFVGANGDQISFFDVATQGYPTTSTFDDIDNAWIPALESLDVGEAFFLSKAAAGTWTRNFTVN